MSGFLLVFYIDGYLLYLRFSNGLLLLIILCIVVIQFQLILIRSILSQQRSIGFLIAEKLHYLQSNTQREKKGNNLDLKI